MYLEKHCARDIIEKLFQPIQKEYSFHVLCPVWRTAMGCESDVLKLSFSLQRVLEKTETFVCVETTQIIFQDDSQLFGINLFNLPVKKATITRLILFCILGTNRNKTAFC